MRGATVAWQYTGTGYLFQSTHPVRGATTILCSGQFRFIISIHAPREGCDYINTTTINGLLLISIHAPREGCDIPSDGTCMMRYDFNPRTP